MEIQDFLGIGLVGMLLSFFIELIKNKVGTTSLWTKILTIALVLIVGTVYYYAQNTAWWATVLGILAVSQTVYNFLIPKEKGPMQIDLER